MKPQMKEDGRGLKSDFMEKLLDGVAVEWKPLGEVAIYANARIGFEELNEENYVGVENLLQNKAGKTNSNYVPTQGRQIQFQVGDILIGNIRPYLKKIWLADRFGGTNGDVLVLHIKDKSVNPRFLYQVLGDDKFFIYNMQYAKGAKMPRGNKEKIMEYLIPIPCPDDPVKSLKIQTEIVRILDTFTELTAELTARKKQYTYYRDQLMQNANSRIEKLEDIAEIYLGLTYTPTYVENGVKFISAQNTSGDFLNLTNVKYISEDEYKNSTSNAKPKRGDVLFTDVTH